MMSGRRRDNVRGRGLETDLMGLEPPKLKI